MRFVFNWAHKCRVHFPISIILSCHDKQVLTFNPDALRYDPATLAGKLVAMREAGISAATVKCIVRDAPRCLSSGAKTLSDRVAALREVFPTLSLSRILEQAPCLLVKKIGFVAQVCIAWYCCYCS